MDSVSPEGQGLVSVSPDAFEVALPRPKDSGLVSISPDAFRVGSVSPEG